jgi:hypothetical protein
MLDFYRCFVKIFQNSYFANPTKYRFGEKVREAVFNWGARVAHHDINPRETEIVADPEMDDYFRRSFFSENPYMLVKITHPDESMINTVIWQNKRYENFSRVYQLIRTIAQMREEEVDNYMNQIMPFMALNLNTINRYMNKTNLLFQTPYDELYGFTLLFKSVIRIAEEENELEYLANKDVIDSYIKKIEEFFNTDENIATFVYVLKDMLSHCIIAIGMILLEAKDKTYMKFYEELGEFMAEISKVYLKVIEEGGKDMNALTHLYLWCMVAGCIINMLNVRIPDELRLAAIMVEETLASHQLQPFISLN